ncbi:MAG TPA: hypothetical protein DDZ11_11720 [Lentisphaeria bacterium]|nr:hypothetical protein [Lentisphaeria bacterium]
MLPVEVHDVPLDLVVTESAVRRCRNDASAQKPQAPAEAETMK